MLAALALMEKGDTSRRFHLYDVFAEMPQPTGRDVDLRGVSAETVMATYHEDTGLEACELNKTRANLLSTGYPADKLVFVKGKVEDTIPGTIPESISILRLDTDWYESTLHELRHLFPRLSPGGVLIVDDYGHWRGAREATDQYFSEMRIPMLLSRIDYTGRTGVKLSQ